MTAVHIKLTLGWGIKIARFREDIFFWKVASIHLRGLFMCAESQQKMLEGVVLLLFWIKHKIRSSLKPNWKYYEIMIHWSQRFPNFDDYPLTITLKHVVYEVNKTRHYYIMYNLLKAFFINCPYPLKNTTNKCKCEPNSVVRCDILYMWCQKSIVWTAWQCCYWQQIASWLALLCWRPLLFVRRYLSVL